MASSRHGSVNRYKAHQNRRLSEDQWERLYTLQGRGCGICGTNRGTLFIDHDHTTGELRGLLCASCNSFVGHRIDKGSSGRTNDQLRLKYALEYVEDPPAREL